MQTPTITGTLRDAAREPIRAGLGDLAHTDQYHRAQVCSTVFDLLAAARSGRVAEYLSPIPITRLHAAQRAFREIGAIRLASALHSAQFSLTRVGIRVPFAQAMATLTASLETHSEDVDDLVARYSQPRLTRLR